MILNNYQILSLYEILQRLRNQEQLYLPVKTGIKILKNIQMIEQEALNVQELRLKIIKGYGVLQSDGKYLIEKEKTEQANLELNELSVMENDFALLKFTVEEIEEIPLSLKELEILQIILGED